MLAIAQQSTSAPGLTEQIWRRKIRFTQPMKGSLWLRLMLRWGLLCGAQSCAASLGMGQVAADTTCSRGYKCCDAACALAVGHANRQVYQLPGTSDQADARTQSDTFLQERSSMPSRSLVPGQGLCVPACGENVIGLTFYRLMLTNAASLNIVDILMAMLYRTLRMACPFEPPAVSCSAGLHAAADGIPGISVCRPFWVRHEHLHEICRMTYQMRQTQAFISQH